MSSQQEQPRDMPAAPQWLDALTKRHKESGYALLALCVGIGILAGWLAYAKGWEARDVVVWLATEALLLLGAGFFQVTRRVDQKPLEPADTRMMVMLLGFLVGVTTTIFSAVLAHRWSNTILGGPEEWRKDWKRLLLFLLAVLAGLALSLCSLQLARAFERSRSWTRQLLYGSNTTVTAALLLAILIVLNIIASVRWGQLEKFNFFNKTFDWTSSQVHTLSPASKNLLRGLDKPVKIYVILPSLESQEVQYLISNCQAVTGKIEAEYLSPDADRKRLGELDRKYQFSDDLGVLVVYGNEPQQTYEFIAHSDIFAQERSQEPEAAGRPRFKFKGENALMTRLRLSDGRKIAHGNLFHARAR